MYITKGLHEGIVQCTSTRTAISVPVRRENEMKTRCSVIGGSV